MQPRPVVLYTRKPSVYDPLADCWGVDRDARLWWGPGPALAHPPCGHWGKYRSNCKQPGADCGPRAIEQIQAFGGIVEHPLGSRLFAHMGIPRFYGQLDVHGGILLPVDQCDFGHAAQKPTLLYIVRPDPFRPIPLPRPQRPIRQLEDLSRAQRQGTPFDFATWLLEILKTCHPLTPG